MSFSKRLPKSVIAKAQDGDQFALTTIYQEFKSPIYSLAYHITNNKAAAEDILQLVIEKVINKVSDVKNPAAFNGWLKTITYREAIDFIGKRKFEMPFEEELPEIHYSEIVHILNETTFDIENYLKILSERERLVVLMFVLEGYSHREIAEELDISESNSKQIYSRSLQKLNLLTKKESFGGSGSAPR
ncbi:RNA polymerase sigma factor [Kangiella sp. TOML190]|uniref:RNA polymerase sigma factor n=1 Tax=Kangiella sp. TOML190 TaxID=2931351 RepID=UPI00203D3EB8|nr:sigma-70 family RNA polymerase sigma factor [Kangiella sp. TOML190]